MSLHARILVPLDGSRQLRGRHPENAPVRGIRAAKAQATMSGVEAGTVLREITQGRVADLVIDEAAKSACDLIAMGTHGRRGFSPLVRQVAVD